MSDEVIVTLRFEPPVSADDLQERFQLLADQMATDIEEAEA